MTAAPSPSWVRRAQDLADEGCPISEISATLGVSADSIRNRVEISERAANEYVEVRREINEDVHLRLLHHEIMRPGSARAHQGA